MLSAIFGLSLGIGKIGRRPACLRGHVKKVAYGVAAMKFDVACAAWQRKHWRACAPASGRSTAGLGGSLVAALIAAGLLGGCASSNDPPASSDARLSRPTRKFTSADYGARVVEPGQPVPKGGGVYKLGAPYRMGGKWYVPREEPGYDAAGTASWYGEDFHGRRTANGEIYDMHALTAAHPTLPLPSYAWVTNQSNGRTVLVRINDRGPYARDRVIDLSRTAARELGYEGNGTAQVRVRYAGPAPLDGNDARERQVLAHAPWRRGPQLAARDEVRPAQPAWKAPRQDLARPVPAVPARAAEPRYAAPAQSRYAASAPSPADAAPSPRYADGAQRGDFGGRDDYAALKAQGRVPAESALAPAPQAMASPPPMAPLRQPEPQRQAEDDSGAADSSGWSVSRYRQGIAGQRRSLGGP